MNKDGVFGSRFSVFAAVLVCLCFVSAPSKSDDTTIIAATPTALLLWLADARGDFDGLSVVVENHQSGVATGKALLAGSAHLATSSDFAFAARALAAPDLRLIATLSSSQTAKLIADGTRVGKTAQDLRGKRIAVTQNSIGQYFLWQYLALNGMEIADVEQTFLRPNGIVAAMSDGTVDAALTWQPFASRIADQLGDRAVFYADQLDQFYYFSLYGRAAWLDANVDRAAEIMSALVGAEAFARENPEHAKRMVAERLDIELEVMNGVWPDHTLRVELPQDIPSVLELAAGWRIDQGLASVATPPNVLDLIDTRPLKTAAPNAVLVIK